MVRVLEVSSPLRARVFVPPDPTGRSVLVWHGGAWCVAGGEEGFAEREADDRELCLGLGAVVVDVDYTLAPEAVFPQQTLEAAAALEWLVPGLAELGVRVDPGRIALHGTSSGAQVVMSLLLAQRDGLLGVGASVAPAGVALVVPSLDLRTSTRVAGLSPDEAREALAVRDQYFGDVDHEDQLVSPALAPRLTGLPPVSVSLGLHDHLRPGGELFCRRAAEQGALVRQHDYDTTHTDGAPEVFAARTAQVIAELAEWT